MNLLGLFALCIGVAPVEGAKPVLENDEVAIWEVTWTEEVASNPWESDTVVVYLSQGATEVSGGASAPQRVNHQPGDVEYVPRNSRTRRRGLSKNGLRSIVVQLGNHPAPALPNDTGLPNAFDRPGIEKALDNERLTAWRYTWAFGKPTPLHFHARDVVAVFLADGVLKSTTPDGKTVLNRHSFGLSRLAPRGRIHFEELVEGKASAVLLELK